MILMSLKTILWIIWSYISHLRPSIPIFRILMELKLRILINLAIKSLIVNIIRLNTRVPIYSLMKRPISGINNYSLY